MNVREWLRSIVEETSTARGRCFDLFVQCLIVISLLSFSLETIPGLPTRVVTVLNRIELITVFLFTVEYGMRAWVAARPSKFMTSFFGVVDLIAILPFYLSIGLDLRSLRALRLLRLFRVLKLVRYSRAIRHFHMALVLAKEELVLFLCVASLLFYFSAVGIYHFEHEAQPEAFSSIFSSGWWAVITLTTVGYGDVYPVTAGGRVFTFFVLMLGLGVVAVPTGIISSALSRAKDMDTSREGDGVRR
jgi:voltage-gated potassium channel